MASPFLVVAAASTEAPPLVGRFAHDDAACDLQTGDFFWYLQFARWSLIGVISEDAWQRYQVDYAAVRGALLASDDQAPE